MSIQTFVTLGFGGTVADVVLLGLSPNVTWPAPASVKLASLPIGQQYITADGSAHLDYIAWKKRFAVTWDQVTTAERDLMRGSLVGGVSFSLTVAGDATYTVFPVRGQYKHSPTGGASETWTVSAMVEVV